MFRKIWYVIVTVVIAMSSQSLVMAANNEQPEGNAQQIIIRTKLIEIIAPNYDD